MSIKMKDAENADVYTARFKMLMEIAVITNKNIAKRLYKKGLIPALQKWLMNLEVTEEPETFEQLCLKTQRHDAIWRNEHQIKNPYTGEVIKTNKDRRYTKDSEGNIEMAATRLSTRRLTPEEREHYQREGKCFRCGEQGHRVRECTQKYAKEGGSSGRNGNPFRQRVATTEVKEEKKRTADDRFKELMALMKEGTAEEQATLRERCEKDFA